jgi:GT2 family glycosyltransferase
VSQLTVSVIVPVHDWAERVTGAVESVHAQTVNDGELVLVDDSTDGFGAAVDEHVAADERVRAIDHETNCGISAARNRASTPRPASTSVRSTATTGGDPESSNASSTGWHSWTTTTVAATPPG